MKKAKVNNESGIRYLSKARPGHGLYAVKIEIACVNGRHGKIEYFYEGNDKALATKIANKVNELMCIGGATKALDWKDYDMEEWLKWQ